MIGRQPCLIKSKFTAILTHKHQGLIIVLASFVLECTLLEVGFDMDESARFEVGAQKQARLATSLQCVACNVGVVLPCWQCRKVVLSSLLI